MAITFQNNISPQIPRNRQKLKRWILDIAGQENKKVGDIHFLLTTDQELLTLNKKYLSHDYFTDIITFDYSDEEIINGDIIISLERVRENALSYEETWNRELKRVVIHGILHLLGHADQTNREKAAMRNAEESALSMVEDLIIV